MRVPILVLALVATPFVASLSQDRGKVSPSAKLEASAKKADVKSDDVQQQGQHEDEKCEKGKKEKGQHNQKGQHEDAAASCASTPPAPAPLPPPVGVAEIHGTVYYDKARAGLMGPYDPGLAGWTVTLSGPVSATTTTDGLGAYAFTALPVGTYTVCEVRQVGWIQTAPVSGATCPSGFGWLLDVPASMPGLWYGTIDFGNFQ
jgi:hypothetical protein